MKLRACQIVVRAPTAASALAACTAGPPEESGRVPDAGVASERAPGGTRSGGVDALYVLDTLGNRAVPAVAFKSARGDRVIEVLAESLWLRSDRTFAARVVVRRNDGGRTLVRSTALAGR